MTKDMKKKNIILIIFVLIFLCSSGGLYFLHVHKQNQSNPFEIAVNTNELVTESKEDYNSVKVYQQNNQLIINAKSEMAFFDGAQFVVQTRKKLDPSDVDIIWTTLGGETEKTEKNDRIIVEIKIQEDGKIIFDKKINFMRKAFDAVENVLEKSKK